MKRITICLVAGMLAASLAISLSGCGESLQKDSAVGSAGINSTEQQTAEADVEETDHFKIEGVYEDSLYRSKEDKDLRLVYVFYRVRAIDEDISVDARTMTMTIGANEYTATYIDSEDNSYFSSYYASDTPKDVSLGDNLKCLTTYLVPEADLAAGNTMTFAYNVVPDIADVHIATSSITVCKGAVRIAKKADPKGYKAELAKRKEAAAASEE